MGHAFSKMLDIDEETGKRSASQFASFALISHCKVEKYPLDAANVSVFSFTREYRCAEQYIRAFRLSNCRTTESIFVSQSQRTLVLTCSVRCEYLFPVALFQWKLSKESIFCSARLFCPSAKTHGWRVPETTVGSGIVS